MNILNMHAGECNPLTAPCILCKARTALQIGLDLTELDELQHLVEAAESAERSRLADFEEELSTRPRAIPRRKKASRRTPARSRKAASSLGELKLTERTRAMLASNRISTPDQLASLSEEAFYELKGADGRHRRNVVNALEKAGLSHKG